MREIVSRFEAGDGPIHLQYLYNLALGISQLLSVILGGDPDESVSSRTGKAIKAGKWWFIKVQGPFIDWLTLEKDHCIKSIEYDEGRKQLWDWAKLKK